MTIPIIKVGEICIFDDGKQGYLCKVIKDGIVPLFDSEKNFEDILDVDEYNRQNH